MPVEAISQVPRFGRRRPVVSLIVSCILLAIVAALIFAVIVAGASVALASHQSSGDLQPGSPVAPAEPAGIAFKGMITDSHCGARHLRNSRLSPAECARSCVRNGASYVLIDGDRRYTLMGQEDELARLAGTRASVTGTRQGDTILVSSTATGF
jgi:hypothetical protein